MFKHPFVVLDLETSGIDPKKDDIIEVALIRYEKGHETGRYQALIQRDKALPDIITVITGITDQLLQEKGENKEGVLKKVGELIQGAYLVGHNIEFDIGFLKAARLPMDLLGSMDTISFTQILFPNLPSYSLESISDHFDIHHKDSHRAMADVEATLELFKRCFNKASSLPSLLINEMKHLLKKTDWKGGLFFEVISESGSPDGGTNSGATTIPQPYHNRTTTVPQQNTGIRRPLGIQELFDESGHIAKHMQRYELRSQQVEMASSVSSAFERGYHLICEAPTGVGKSMAYLSAAVEVAIANKSKVVISTNTVNLQQQLFEKDVPLLKEIYQKVTGHEGVQVALLKGRSHYLCLRRLDEFKNRGKFSQEEIVLLLKIILWQSLYSEKDMGDMTLMREETLIWDFELSADQKYCTPQKCQRYGTCYLHKARKKAEEADIIIVNHALLCADLEAEGSLLPDYNYLVVDEAHHFEEVATKSFGTQIRQAHFAVPIKNISGQLSHLQKGFGRTLFTNQSVFEGIPELVSEAATLQESIHRFFDVLALFIGRNVPQSGFIENLLIDQVVLGMEEWVNVGSSFAEIQSRIKQWVRSLLHLIQSLQALGEGVFPSRTDFIEELSQEINVLNEPLIFLSQFFSDDIHSDLIRWMTSDAKGLVTIHAVPVRVGPTLLEKLYDQKKSIIFTSATLGVRFDEEEILDQRQGPFDYFKKMMGIDGEQFEELILDSPFDFETQAYVITPSDLIPVVSRDNLPQTAHIFESLIERLQGSMMGLFTSHGALQKVYMHLSQSTKTHGTRILGQRLSGGRGKILKAYLNDPSHSALLGVNSFWEGVDIQGDALTTLLIHKLPFDVPSDPIVKVRNQMFNNGFMEYSVPRAILRFRQGFGRLIRSKKDYGVMIVLDNRVMTKKYGKLFLKSLPPGVTIEKMPFLELTKNVKEWLDLMKNDIAFGN